MIFVLSCLNLILVVDLPAKKTNVRSKRKNSVSNNTRAIDNKGQIVLEAAIIFCIVIAFFMLIFYTVIHPVNVMMVKDYQRYKDGGDICRNCGKPNEVKIKIKGRIEVTQPH